MAAAAAVGALRRSRLGAARRGAGRMAPAVAAQSGCTSGGEAIVATGGAGGSDGLVDAWVVHQHFDELDSTQTFVEREHASFDQHLLTAVSADFQTAGRGTRDRSWLASRGKSVLVSFFFRFPRDCETDFVNRSAPNVTKVLAIAAVEALQWASRGHLNRERDELTFGIKWPNDVVVDGGKIGGILARAIPSPGPRLDGIIVGIGLNINTAEADLNGIDRPVWPATSLHAAVGSQHVYDLESIRWRLIQNFARELQIFFVGGFPAFRERVNGLEVLLGTQVCFRVSDAEVLDGAFAGVDDDGLIILQLPSGESKAFPSGEIVPLASARAGASADAQYVE